MTTLSPSLPRSLRLAAVLASVAALFTGVRAKAQADAAPTEAPAPAPEYVALDTSKGVVVLELDAAKAPVTVANFLQYVDDGHYTGTVFHRVIPGFVAQGGGFTTEGAEKPTRSPIVNEFKNGLSNARGTIAMARTSDPDSATAQFYINVGDNLALDTARPQTGNAGYCVFGKVVHGMDVVDAITAVQTTLRRTPQGSMGDWPAEDVVITAAKRLTKAQADEITGASAAAEPAPADEAARATGG